MSNTNFALSDLEAAAADFSAAHPAYDPQGTFAELRRTDYHRLDATHQIYLDYTGGGLHAASQIEAHTALLRDRVLGNPHSANPTSRAMTTLIESARAYVREFFNAPTDEYLCVFTPNASGALRLVGEAYRFAPGGQFALTYDNHNSVNGIREFARRAGADITYVPVVAPDLRLDRSEMSAVLQAADPCARNLLAFPAQSNYSGVQHPLDLIDEARSLGWDVLVDMAAFAPTNPIDIAASRPDYASFSFYKLFGYPTGIGCLLIRKDRLGTLKRPWFAGGTITVASVQGDGHYLHGDEAAYEDGTVDYLNIPAVETGLGHLATIGMHNIHEHVTALTDWLLTALESLHHSDGRPMVQLFGPATTKARGATVSFALIAADGVPFDDRRIEELANEAGISIRTGCFCNPGAGEIAHGLDADALRQFFGREAAVSFLELRGEMLERHEVLVSAIRVSFGVASNFIDVYRLAGFLAGFIDRSSTDISPVMRHEIAASST